MRKITSFYKLVTKLADGPIQLKELNELSALARMLVMEQKKTKVEFH